MAEDRLERYREKRALDATPEPEGKVGAAGDVERFVIQEHHARRLHWDLRLERDGVLVSWALPRGVPADPSQNRLAVRTEDHPLEYIDFHGEIPPGQYGAGTMEIWDHGTYEAEKFEADKIIVRFAGGRVRGRFSLFQTKGDNWMIHRMDPPDEGWEAMPEELEPMRATRGTLPPDDGGWGFEIRWEGARALAFCEPGHLRLVAADGEVTRTYPEVRGVLAQLHARPALLDGVLVALGEDGQPDGERLERRRAAGSDSAIRRLRRTAPVAYVAFDLLHVGGTPMLELSYEERRAALEALDLDGDAWQVPAYHRGDGAAFLAAGARRGLGAVVAKRLAGAYTPGRRNRDWLEIRTPPPRSS